MTIKDSTPSMLRIATPQEGNFGDFGVRKYDEGIGRFTSTDPLFEKYPGWTPYQYSMNNPVNGKDGNGKYFDYSKMNKTEGGIFQQQIFQTILSNLKSNSKAANEMITRIEKTDYAVKIVFKDLENKAYGSTPPDKIETKENDTKLKSVTVEFDMKKITDDNKSVSTTTAHELEHVIQLDDAQNNGMLNDFLKTIYSTNLPYNQRSWGKEAMKTANTVEKEMEKK